MDGSTATVLLVEDNPDDVRVIVDTLKKTYPAIDLQVVHDGAEALDCIFGTGLYKHHGDHYTPDLIILDLSLPKVNGREVLRILRAYARTRTIPVVILSSSTESPIIEDTYQRGANSYVHKPISARTFRESVQAIASYWLKINARPPASDEQDTAESTSS